MKIERYENTGLELIYKKVLVCEKCKKKYGQDTPNPKNTLCPFCERELFRPRNIIKKKKNMKQDTEDEELNMNF